MKLEILINSFIFLSLFILNIIINNYNYYFLIIYLFINIYHIYILSIIISNNKYKNKFFMFMILSIILNFFTYYIICDPNPVLFFITYYIFSPCFFKAILIVFIHTYFLSLYQKKEKFFKNFENSIIKNKTINHDFYKSNYYVSPKKYYFLSNFIKYFSKNKKLLTLFFLLLILLFSINVFLFLNRIKLWTYFNKKEKTLPISSSENTTFYITAMIVNMEEIINNFINQMKHLIFYLGEKNVIVSIVENGDSLDKTKEYLKLFQDYLNKKKIINKIIMKHVVDDPRKKKHNFKKYGPLRIKFYSKLRNKCFDLLYKLPNLNFNKIKIIYFNDIYFKYEDIINLISTNNEEYDAVCAMDFSNIFYDRWVSIDLDGNSLFKKFPFFLNKEAQDLILNHKPVRVFSCWNGVIVFTGSPLKNKNLQFRYKKYNKKSKYKINNCQKVDYESECTYFHIDLFNLGYTKKFINPNVRVTYKYKYFNKRKYFYLSLEDIKNYFILYLESFKVKRNKFMSNYNDKKIKFNKMVEKWYIENK